MSKIFFVKLGLLSLMMISAFWLTGCLHGGSVDVTHNVAQPTGTLTGKLIDNATGEFLGGVTVAVIVNGVKQTAVTNNSSDPDLKGIFTFSGLPAGIHTFKAQVDGYAVTEISFSIAQSADNTPASTNLGQIHLSKPFTLTVVVTNEGIPVQGVRVAAHSQFAYPQTTSITSGITNALGHVEISGLNQLSYYWITASPADINGDGVYDYQAATVNYEGATNSDKIFSLPITKAQRDDQIALVFSSLGKYGSPNTTLRRKNISGIAGEALALDNIKSFAAKDQLIYLVFNYPVTLDGEVSIFHKRLLINPDQVNNTTGAAPADGIVDADFNADGSLPVTATLDATGTILTIVPPPGGYPKDDVITIMGKVRANIRGVPSTMMLSSLIGESTYIFDDTATGLNASGIITADNYNGSDNNYITASVPYVEFPEYVYGTVRYISVTHTQGTSDPSDDVSVIIDGSANPTNPAYFGYPLELIYTDGSAAATCATCGTGAGTFARVPLPDYWNARVTDGDKVTVQIDVKDVEGNEVKGTYTLTIQ